MKNTLEGWESVRIYQMPMTDEDLRLVLKNRLNEFRSKSGYWKCSRPDPGVFVKLNPRLLT